MDPRSLQEVALDEGSEEESGKVSSVGGVLGALTYPRVRKGSMNERRHGKVIEVCKDDGYRWRDVVP